MNDLIQRLDKWLRANRPEYYDYLLPGLSDEEIMILEKALKVELPEDFKLFYKWKNGQKGQSGCLIPALEWLKAERVISSSRNAPSVEADGFVNWTDEMWEKDKSQKWITFLSDSTANEYILDLQGVFDGKPNQIVSFWSDALGGDLIMHESFYKWLETVVMALEKGFFTEDEDDRSLADYDNYYKLLSENNPGYPISTWKGDVGTKE
jgi:cell wall assembly regulator SMI1